LYFYQAIFVYNLPYNVSRWLKSGVIKLSVQNNDLGDKNAKVNKNNNKGGLMAAWQRLRTRKKFL
jgi:hypothetical protein